MNADITVLWSINIVNKFTSYRGKGLFLDENSPILLYRFTKYKGYKFI